jgi:hypothetical protein
MRDLKLGFADTFDTAKRFFTETLSQYYNVIRDDDAPDYLIFGDRNFGETHYRYTECKKIFYTGENIWPNYFTYDHAISFDHENSPKHYRLPLYVLEMKMMTYEGWTDDYLYLVNRKIDVEQEYANKKRFCTFVQSNPTCEMRNNFFKFLDGKKRVDSAGPHLNNTGFILPRTGMHHKLNFAREGKFNIAFENGSRRGYATEKILNAFYSNTIPIYWGSDSIGREFNTKAFINCHDYQTFDQVIDRVFEIDNNKNLYCEMLSEPVFKKNIPNEYTNLHSFYKWFDTFVYEG